MKDYSYFKNNRVVKLNQKVTLIEIIRRDKEIARFKIEFGDVKIVRQYPWFVHEKNCCSMYYDDNEINLSHLLLGRPPNGYSIIHLNGDKTDYRRKNLRMVPKSVAHYFKKVQDNYTTGLRGLHHYQSGSIVANHGSKKFICKSLKEAKKVRKIYDDKMKKYIRRRNKPDIPIATLASTIEKEYVEALHAAGYA